MPIVTKKDQLSISMTWSSADDALEIDISVSRNGDSDVQVVMSSGKNTIKFDPSCVVELYDFLTSKGIVNVPVIEDPDKDQQQAQIPMSAESASHDLISLIEEAKRSSFRGLAQHPPVVHSASVAPSNGPAYASPSLVAASASAFDLEPGRAVAPLVTGAASDVVELLNESDADVTDDPIEMGEIPPDIFGR